jgi:hypothetical protein
LGKSNLFFAKEIARQTMFFQKEGSEIKKKSNARWELEASFDKHFHVKFFSTVELSSLISSILILESS